MSDYTELVQRLREQYMDTKQMLPNVLCHDSADAITALQAQAADSEARYQSLQADAEQLIQDLAAARAEVARLQDENRGLRAEFDSELAAAMALLRKLAVIGVTANPGVLHHYRCGACGGSWSGRPMDAEKHMAGCLVALAGKDAT